MQKRANRILSMLLALIMVMTMLPATVFANSETDVFAGWSLTLGEDIGVNFYLAEEAANYTVDVTVAGNKAAYTTATKDGYYVVSVNVAAAQMTDVITLNVKNGDTQVHTGEYTVRQYAEKILTGAYDAEVKELVKQMLNLGAAAQTYFAYNTDPLANKGYEIDTPAAVPTEVPAIALEDNLDGVSLYGMSLLFQSKTAVRFYFVVDGDVANYTFKVGGEACEVKNSEDLYYVEIGDINPQDLGNEITVTVNDALSVSYNPLTYIVRKYNSDSSSAALKNLVQAMYGYYLESLDYLKYQQIIQLGALQTQSGITPWVKNANETFIDFNTVAYTAPNGEYTSLTADAIKLVRGGETYSVANPGQGLLIKESESGHKLKITPWGMTGGHLPIQAHDYFIIEGRFVSTGGDGTTIQIAKSYIYFDGTTATVSTTEPILPQTYNLGNLMRDPDSGHSWSSSGVYMYVADNDAPYLSDWTLEYAPTSNSVIKRIRGDETIDVAIAGRGTLVKYGANALYLYINSWTMGENQPAQDGDIYIIEGDFYNAATKATIHLSKTYVYLNGADVEFSTEMPTLPTVIEGGAMQSHSNSHSDNGIYFKLDANAAPYNGWDYEYTQTSVDNLKLIRDGVETSIGIVGRPLIIKYGETDYYLKLEQWNVGGVYGMNGGSAPITTDDILIVEGDFAFAAQNVTMNITKSYVYFDGSKWVCSAEEPAQEKTVDVVSLAAHSNGWSSTSAESAGGMTFAAAENDAPFATDWSLRYKPVSSDVIKLIRDGVEYTIANTGADAIIKYSATEYYLEFWPFAEHKPMLAGDELIIEGLFFNEANNTYINVEKTYITLNAGGTITVVNKFVDNEADTEFGKVVLPTSNKNMTIGVWNGSYHVFDHKQLQELQAAGITKIVGIDTQWIGTTGVNGWLDRVYSYGISVIFDLRDWDGETVPDYASHPGVLGFLMYDEPSTQQFDELAALKAKFDAIDAFDGKLFYVNLLASCVADSSLFGDGYNKLKTDYDQYYVTEFLNKLDIQVLSWDNYSLISQADDTSAKGIRTDYFYNFEVMANKAAQNNLPLWYIMLAAGHNSGAENTVYNAPTAEELRWQMAVAMTYGVQNIDQYVYVSHESDYSSMVKYDTWEPTALYYDIKTVNNEYLAWDNIFTAYNWVGVGKYSANSKDTMLDQLENCLTLSNYGIAGISANENMLIGVFENNGSKAYMLTNAGSTSTSWFSGDVGDGREFNMADSTVTLTLDAADYKCVAVINNGEISYVAVNNNQVTLNVEAYEGVFVIPILN